MTITAEEIQQLCDKWCEATNSPDGTIELFSRNTEQYRLLRNGVQFHMLDHDALMASITGLTQVLLRPGLNSIIAQDHYGLWSWCGEILTSGKSVPIIGNESEIKSLITTCLRAALAGCRKPPMSRDEADAQFEEISKIHRNVKGLIDNSHLALAYLSFPLLEAITKKVCEQYVEMDGSVKQSFQVGDKERERKYKPNGSFREKQCSSLRDLLILFYDQVADPGLRIEMTKFRNHLQMLCEDKDPFELIYQWRNQSLHGSTSFQTIGGAILNLILLICMYQYKDRYTQVREGIIKRCELEVARKERSPWSFYPPY